MYSQNTKLDHDIKPVHKPMKQFRHSVAARHGAKPSFRGLSRGDKALLRLLICAFIFLSVTVVKTVYPQSTQGLRDFVSERVNGGIDYKEAVETIGEVLTGKQDIVEVFNQLAFGESDNGKNDEASGQSARPEESASPPPSAIAEDENNNLQTPGSAQNEDAEAGGSAGNHADALSSRSSIGKDQTPEVQIVEHLSVVDSAEEYDDGSAEAAQLTDGYMQLPSNVDVTCYEFDFEYADPLVGEITSEFGCRSHPLEGDIKFHYGIDIAGAKGKAISCFADGAVQAVGYSTYYGNYVRVLHKDGVLSFYGHCSEVYVATGDIVKLGDTIAAVGSTGKATGSHLHFEVHYGDRILNPAYYLTNA